MSAKGGAVGHVVVEVVEKGFKKADDFAAKAGRTARKVRDPYRRPSGYRKGVRQTVYNAHRGSDGIVRDPLTKRPIRQNERWDMGHKPGYEFRKHQASARQRGITRKEFLNEHNNPDHYRPELPSSNSSHAGEDPSDRYDGP